MPPSTTFCLFVFLFNFFACKCWNITGSCSAKGKLMTAPLVSISNQVHYSEFYFNENKEILKGSYTEHREKNSMFHMPQMSICVWFTPVTPRDFSAQFHKRNQNAAGKHGTNETGWVFTQRRQTWTLLGIQCFPAGDADIRVLKL